jgi:hypothetical protein
MRQEHHVHAIRLQRQRCRVGDERDAGARVSGDERRAARAGAGQEGLGLTPGADLHAMEPERELERIRDDRAFLLEQEASERSA